MKVPSRITVLMAGLLAVNIAFSTDTRVLFEDETVAYVSCPGCEPTISPEIAERSKVFTRRVFELTPNAYAAMEYVGSSVMVVGPEGAVVVGMSVHLGNGKLIAGHFANLREDKPIKAIIYNDSLGDNYGGVEAFISEADAASGDVAVIAHKSFESIIKNFGDIGNIMAMRSAYMAGGFLETGPKGSVHTGLIAFDPGKTSYIAPNTLVDKYWEGSPGGVKTQIYHFPAESDDGIVTYFPEQKTLVVGHVLFGDVIPQTYTHRGIKRDPKRWYKGIEDLIALVEQLDVEYMIPMHFFEPIAGRERIMEILLNNRDVLQYISDQGARYIDKGFGPDELANAVKLPPHLAKLDYMQEHYGRMQQHMRQMFYDHLGWFEGDPTFLDPLPNYQRAQHYIQALGGRQSILEQAQAADQQGEKRWAAELLTWLLIVNPGDTDALEMKADILRQLGYAETTATYRNWFLTSAMEMQGGLPETRMDKSAFVPAEILAALTPLEMLEELKPRLKAELAFETDTGVNLCFNDKPDCVLANIRRGVLATRTGTDQSADFTLRMNTRALRGLIDNTMTLAQSLSDGAVVVEQGDAESLIKMEGLFEPAKGGEIKVALPIKR